MNAPDLQPRLPTYAPPQALARTAHVAGRAAYDALVAEAEADHEGYWARLAREFVGWKTPFIRTLDSSDAPHYRWFEDGTLNVSWNCLDRQVAAGRGDKVAIVFESDDGQVTRTTYAQLLAQTCRMANALKSLGVRKGDRVVIYMPMSVEGVVAMQACARLGAVHSVVFGGFSAHALRDRVADTGATVIVTAAQQVRGGKRLPLKALVDEALALGGCEAVRSVVVHRRTGEPIEWTARDVWMHEITQAQGDSCEPEWVGAEHPLFLLYTSGSTGKPKGVQHCSGGYLLHAALTTKWTFDMHDDDVFWCTADIGWVTGHTYIAYGPLAIGATQVVFEGVPTYPDAGRFWQMIERHRVTVFYTAPTAIRSLIKAAEGNPAVHPDRHDLGSLRVLGSVGEPINPAAWEWYRQHVGGGRCPVLDTDLVPGSCTLPFPGIAAAIVDETGNDVPDGESGLLVIKKPWPSMIRAVWGDDARYRSSYFPPELRGCYLAGDGAARDRLTRYFTIGGRIDDVLNVSGHRMGTMEIESALVACAALVAEAAVVGRPDETTGEAISAFVVLKQPRPTGKEGDRLAAELRAWIGKEIGPIAKPREIRFADNLPKTRSGKIMRRLLRSVARGEAISQDVSTLENPAILDQLTETH
jgi:acetyl-CoA synthetase